VGNDGKLLGSSMLDDVGNKSKGQKKDLSCSNNAHVANRVGRKGKMEMVKRKITRERTSSK